MLCVKCGSTIPDESRFCPECGLTQTPVIGDQTALYRTNTGGNNENSARSFQEIDLDKTTADLSQGVGGVQSGWQPEPSHDPPPAYAQQPQYAPPPAGAVAPGGPQAQQGKKKLSGLVLAIIIAIPILIIGGLVIYFVTSSNDKNTDEPEVIETEFVVESDDDIDSGTAAATPEVVIVPDVSYVYQSSSPEAVIDITAVDSIFPSNYRSLEAIATFTGYCDYGEMDVLIEMEIPGFTQPYKQKITLGRQVEKLRIVPPLVTGSIDLNSEKTAQLIYSVTESDSGKLLVQESKNIKLYSKYDIIWNDGENAYAYMDNFLAWLTPDAPEIIELKRDAIDYLSYITDGQLEMLVGYQDVFGDVYLNTWAQVIALQGAVSDIAGVRYNMSPFTMDSQQRVMLPADVLNTRSGICVETSLVMASALQSAGMNCMLVFPPGHAQVAVEIWPDTGEYCLIETTTLPMDMSYDGWNSAVMYLDQDEWWGYLSGEGSYTLGVCYVLDCGLGAKLGIRAMTN